MDDLNEIFERATDADLDTELAAAGELLQKIAQQEGVDLSELSDEDVAELMVDLLPKTAADENGHESARGEHGNRTMEETKMATEITFADVAVELSKVAASEGIDLDGLDREQYHELFDIVAESMQDPNYMENKLAEDEANMKLAEADALGRHMARAFMDEQEKVAASKEVLDRIAAGEERRTKKGVPPVPDKPVGAHVRETAAKVKQVAQRTGEKALSGVDRVGGEVGNVINRTFNRPLVHGGRKYVNPRNVGAGALILGTAGTAYGAKKLLDRKSSEKRSFDEEALEMARDYLLENGIDPDTGNKLASYDENDVAERAAEILAEAGWL